MVFLFYRTFFANKNKKYEQNKQIKSLRKNGKNITNLMSWATITARFVVTISSVQMLNFLLPVGGQAFLKPIKKVPLTNGTPLMGWKG